MIALSDVAIDRIERLNTQADLSTRYLRISVTGGGCSGLQYKLDFTNERFDTDVTYEFAGGAVSVVIDPKSLPYLQHLQLDYDDSLSGKGWLFINPDAAKSCGCGTSFSL